MRNIRNQCFENMVSPIRFVMKHIHEAIVNIAPENSERFDKEYPDFILEYLDSSKWVCEVDVGNKHIKLSRRVVELFWGVSYGYMTYYTKVIQKKRIDIRTNINLHENEDVKKAMLLLQWVYESWLNNEDVPWPEELPKPIENPKQGTMENVADELCLCSIAYSIHHELAHIRLSHSGESTLEQEKEADSEATDWLLNHNLDEWDYKFIKRALGIAVAFEVLTAHGIYTENFGGITHPYTYDRLYNNLDRYISDDSHLVWALLTSTLKLHLDNKGIKTPDIEYKDFKECVNSYIDLLSNK